MKFLTSNKKNFDKNLNRILQIRKNKIKKNSNSVLKIIKDVKKNGDKALLRYEIKFNKNSTIVPSKKQITRSILTLNKNVKKAVII